MSDDSEFESLPPRKITHNTKTPIIEDSEDSDSDALSFESTPGSILQEPLKDLTNIKPRALDSPSPATTLTQNTPTKQTKESPSTPNRSNINKPPSNFHSRTPPTKSKPTIARTGSPSASSRIPTTRDITPSKVRHSKPSDNQGTLVRTPRSESSTPRAGTSTKYKPTALEESIWNKLYLSGMGQKAKKSRVIETEIQRRNNVEEQKLKQICTFKPNITEVAHKSTQGESVYHRLLNVDPKKREIDRKAVIERLENAIKVECTFRPTTNAIPVNKNNGVADRPKNLFERLHRDAQNRERRRQIQLERALELEDLAIQAAHIQANRHFAERVRQVDFNAILPTQQIQPNVI